MHGWGRGGKRGEEGGREGKRGEERGIGTGNWVTFPKLDHCFLHLLNLTSTTNTTSFRKLL